MENEDALINKLPSDLPKISDKNCDGINVEGFGNLTECMTLDQCEDILESPDAPDNIHVCGWDGSVAKMMICCTKRKIISSRSTFISAPRFPKYQGQPRIRNMDKSPFCQRWKANGACKLDTHFSIRINDSSYPGEDPYYADYYNIFDDEYDYGSSEFIFPGVYNIESWDMFSFMQKACMTTCGWTWPGTAVERNKVTNE